MAKSCQSHRSPQRTDFANSNTASFCANTCGSRALELWGISTKSSFKWRLFATETSAISHGIRMFFSVKTGIAAGSYAKPWSWRAVNGSWNAPGFRGSLVGTPFLCGKKELSEGWWCQVWRGSWYLFENPCLFSTIQIVWGAQFERHGTYMLKNPRARHGLWCINPKSQIPFRFHMIPQKSYSFVLNTRYIKIWWPFTPW